MKNEQMTMDTRPEDVQTIHSVTTDAIESAGKVLEGSRRRPVIRSRQEAYGVVAQRIPAMNAAIKSIQKGATDLLYTLDSPNLPAVEPLSAIINRVEDAAALMIEAAAVYKIALRALFECEENDVEETPPLFPEPDSEAAEEPVEEPPEEPMVYPDEEETLIVDE